MNNKITYPPLVSQEEFGNMFYADYCGENGKWADYVKDFDLQAKQIWLGRDWTMFIWEVYPETNEVQMTLFYRSTNEVKEYVRVNKRFAIANIYISNMTPGNENTLVEEFIKAYI